MPDTPELRNLRRKVRVATLTALEGLGGEGTRAELRERVLRDACFTHAERALPAPENAAHKYGTFIEYQFSWTLTNLRREGLASNPRKGVWALAGAAAEAPEPVAAPVHRTRLDELRAMPYPQYLRSPEWRETRAAALHRVGHACQLDSTHVEDLEVHHRDYSRLGEELPADLTVLCRSCHRLHHKEHGRPRRPQEPPPVSAGPPLYVPETWTQPAPRERTSWLQRLLALHLP